MEKIQIVDVVTSFFRSNYIHMPAILNVDG